MKVTADFLSHFPTDDPLLVCAMRGKFSDKWLVIETASGTVLFEDRSLLRASDWADRHPLSA